MTFRPHYLNVRSENRSQINGRFCLQSDMLSLFSSGTLSQIKHSDALTIAGIPCRKRSGTRCKFEFVSGGTFAHSALRESWHRRFRM